MESVPVSSSSVKADLQCAISFEIIIHKKKIQNRKKTCLDNLIVVFMGR